MKIRITDPVGVHFGGRILPQGSEHDISGAHANAWLRFKQAEEIKPAAKADAKAEKKK